MTVELFNDEVKVKHFLKADSFGQIITVYNKENNNKASTLVEDYCDFFDHIYEDATGELTINGVQTPKNIDQLLNENNNFAENLNCMLFFIEGYAGCGKSTLVQHILYEVLDNHNYDYSYYNYDIGLYPEDLSIYSSDNSSKNHDNEIDFIKYSVMIGLKKQIVDILDTSNGKNIFKSFLLLIDDDNSLEKLDATLRIKMNFAATRALNSAVNSVLNSKNIIEKNQKISDLKTVLDEQLKSLSTYQLLCIDYLWRLAQYLVDSMSYQKYMYVCYDNLDSIMNYDILCEFKDKLITFRNNLSRYISQINRNIIKDPNRYGESIKRLKPFVIFTTYRKITAIRSNIKHTEMFEDMIVNSNYVKIIEVSNQYNFTQVAQRRINHFSSKLRTNSICGTNSQNLIDQMSLVIKLKEMTFVKYTYAGLWNNNFRSCSNVLSELIEHDNFEINKCVDLFNENFDGHIKEKSCYYGASSLFLHSICKLLNKLNIFDSEHLDLINIKEDAETKMTSLSRLIITYIHNKKYSVSIKELFDTFDEIFAPKYICKILGQLIKRVEGEIWRRPIYYSKHALENEHDIENKLYGQYNKYKNNEDYDYVEFKICNCGETYINSVVPQFEFYSIRVNEHNKDLYCVNKEDELYIFIICDFFTYCIF